MDPLHCFCLGNFLQRNTTFETRNRYPVPEVNHKEKQPTPKSSYKSSLSPVPIFGEQIPLDPLHKIVEPGHHGPALVQRLGRDDLIAEVLEVFLVEKDEPEEGAGHGPLVATVLEHDDVENGGEHLLQDLGMNLDDLNQGVVLQVRLQCSAPNFA